MREGKEKKRKREKKEGRKRKGRERVSIRENRKREISVWPKRE